MNQDSIPEPVLIQHGTVIDGSGAAPVKADVRIRAGRISEIGPNLAPDGMETLDAAGCLVVPGLIDLHVHVFSGAGHWAIDPEQAGLRAGVTTMLDTGTAGALMYETFHRCVIPQAEEEVFALINISLVGCLLGHPDREPIMGELNDDRYLHVPSVVECIERFPDRALGVKVRLSSMLADGRRETEELALRRALEAAVQTGTFLMVHHTGSQVPTADMLDALRPGDVVTHLYHRNADSAFEGETRAPSEAVRRARDRGVLLDVGHGVGSFDWDAAEPACRDHDFWPDTISTDVHAYNLNGPVHDMCTTMSKFLYLGMPLEGIIRASTQRPAEALGMADRLGTLLPDRQADIALLKINDGAQPLYDVLGASGEADRCIVPVSVFKRGVHHPCQEASIVPPSPETWTPVSR